MPPGGDSAILNAVKRGNEMIKNETVEAMRDLRADMVLIAWTAISESEESSAYNKVARIETILQEQNQQAAEDMLIECSSRRKAFSN